MVIKSYELNGRVIELVYEGVLDYYKIKDNQNTDHDNIVFLSKTKSTEAFDKHIEQLTEVKNDVAL